MVRSKKSGRELGGFEQDKGSGRSEASDERDGRTERDGSDDE
jgi:hypothetical protein